MTGDHGMEGYVLIDNSFAVYPQEVDGIGQGVGWGVSVETVIPGFRSLGDPGYPDEVDVVDIAMPYVESVSIVGKLRFPRTYQDAMRTAIREAIDRRLGDAFSHGGDDERDDSADA